MMHNLMDSGRLDRAVAKESLRKFLEDLLRAARLELRVAVRALPEDAAPDDGVEIFADLSGPDAGLLTERGGELLQAIEHLAYRALRLEPPFQDKVFLDCAGYRAVRIEELKMIARAAAERVESSRQPFKLNPMSSRERRIVHLALQAFPAVRTESIGVGPERQVVVYPADAKPPR